MIYTITLHPCIDVRLTLDHLPKNNEMIRLSQNHQAIAGGKGVNVSRTLSVLGEKSICLMAAGGEHSEEFCRLMKKETFDKVYFSSESVRTNYELCAKGHICEINEKAQATETTLTDILSYLDQHLEAYDLVVIAGSLPEKIDSSSIGSLIEKCHEKQAIVFADTSGDALKTSVEAGADYIKPNEEEMIYLLEQMVPMFPIQRINSKELKTKDKILLLLDGIEEFVSVFGVSVICTMGSNGSCYVDQESSVYSPAFAVKKPIRVKGAGDTYLATFIYALVSRRLPLFECLRMASSSANAWIQTEHSITKDQLLNKYESEKSEEQ